MLIYELPGRWFKLLCVNRIGESWTFVTGSGDCLGEFWEPDAEAGGLGIYSGGTLRLTWSAGVATGGGDCM
jgi:hypothetical protein